MKSKEEGEQLGAQKKTIEKILELKEQHTVQAMSLYEFLDLLLTAIPILIDLIQRLLRRRKKHRRKK